MIIPDGLIEQLYIERKRQLQKWGRQPHGIAEWLSIIAEELEEVNRAAHETGAMFPTFNIPKDATAVKHLRYELIQVATCCLATLEECPDLKEAADGA